MYVDTLGKYYASQHYSTCTSFCTVAYRKVKYSKIKQKVQSILVHTG